MRYFYKFTVELCVHLFSNFLSEVLFFLLDSFTGLETNEAFYCYGCVVFFSNLCFVLSYGLFSVFCFYVYLVKQADLFELFVDTTRKSPRNRKKLSRE